MSKTRGLRDFGYLNRCFDIVTLHVLKRWPHIMAGGHKGLTNGGLEPYMVRGRRRLDKDKGKNKEGCQASQQAEN